MNDIESPPTVGRRGFLLAAAVGAGAVVGPAVAQEEDEDDVVIVELVDFAFEPGTDAPLRIEPGTTVRFVWITDTHNIAILEQPEASDWEGVEAIEDAGFEHEHTFEVEGTYEFVCVPHEALGMFGTIEVVEDDTIDLPVGPEIPEDAMTLAVGITIAFAAVLGFAYVFLKYGPGGPPGE